MRSARAAGRQAEGSRESWVGASVTRGNALKRPRSRHDPVHPRPDVHLGPSRLHPFGLLVATGSSSGPLATTRAATGARSRSAQFVHHVDARRRLRRRPHARRDFRPPDEIARRCTRCSCSGRGSAPSAGSQGPSSASCYGSTSKYLPSWKVRRAQTLSRSFLQRRDLAVFPVAWIFGRSGCSTVHDHPGFCSATRRIRYG